MKPVIPTEPRGASVGRASRRSGSASRKGGQQAGRRSLTRVVAGLGLPAVLLGAFVLRSWGSDFGLPAYTRYHPDEQALVERAAAILWTGDWDLHRYNYPPFYAYLQTAAYALYFVWGAAHGLWNTVMPFTVPQYYHIGRLLTGIVGTLTVLVVFLVGRQLKGRRVGLLAAALLGGCYLHTIHSHYATFDVMVGLLVSLTLLFSLLLWERKSARWYALAGLCAGLAGATKYNGAVVVVVPLLAHVLSTPWGEWGWLNSKLWLLAAGFGLGFFGGNPFALGHMPGFLSGLAQVFYHYGTQHPGFEGRGNWRWYASVFLTSADALWVVVGLLGLVWLVWRDWRRGLLVVVFPLIYFVMMSRFVVRFERNMVPLLPFVALGGAWFVDFVGDRIGRAMKRGRKLSALASFGVLALVLAPSVVAAITFDAAISRTDLREVAGQWVEANVPPGARIAVESYSIPFDHSRYEVEDVVRISDHDLDWYREHKFDVLILSDGVWEILRAQPDVYAAQVGVFNQIASQATLLQEFVPRAPWLTVAGYPTVSVYHFAPVRIFSLTE